MSTTLIRVILTFATILLLAPLACGTESSEDSTVAAKSAPDASASQSEGELRSPPQCRPATCASRKKDCGTIADGCGRDIDCGPCGVGETCDDNVCTSCTRTTCAAEGKDCGEIPDGCGGAIECGPCASPSKCVGGVCTACVPLTCATSGKQCGSVADGCGHYLDCGGCTAGQTCDAANTCTKCPAATGGCTQMNTTGCQGQGDICLCDPCLQCICINYPGGP